MKHYPVMLNEVLDALDIQDGNTYVDATFGNGGYTQAILNKANCTVIALDRDPSVLPRVGELQEQYKDRFIFRQGQFGHIKELINERVDGVVFDIGVSSMQLDQGERGFSFSKEAPLDMRMSKSGQSAYDVVNQMPTKELADIIYKYGEEKKSRQIAQAIDNYRKDKKIETTTELAEIIYKVIFKKFGQIDPATRTFQAIRIFVNNELEELENGLSGGLEVLKENGKLVVVSFHSLEDRIVKNFFNQHSGKNQSVSRYMPISVDDSFYPLTKVSKAIAPSSAEIAENSRSRSAKLRHATKKGDPK